MKAFLAIMGPYSRASPVATRRIGLQPIHHAQMVTILPSYPERCSLVKMAIHAPCLQTLLLMLKSFQKSYLYLQNTSKPDIYHSLQNISRLSTNSHGSFKYPEVSKETRRRVAVAMENINTLTTREKYSNDCSWRCTLNFDKQTASGEITGHGWGRGVGD